MFHRIHLVVPTARCFSLKTVANNHGRLICFRDTTIIVSGSCLKSKSEPHVNLRWKSTRTEEQTSVSEVKGNKTSELTIGQKVKQTTKDASYLGVIIIGIGVTGVMFYAILSELFSNESPNSVYTDTLKLCCNDTGLTNILGQPVKGYGELSSRGRRRHVSHFIYDKDGIKHMRMRFYVEGIRKKGTVHLEVKQNSKGKYEYRYLFVDIDGQPPQTYILQDNRHEDNTMITDFKM